MTETMRAVVGEELGGVENYAFAEVPIPEPKAGEVLIKVSVSGMGYVDGLVSRGLYQVKPEVPYTPGLEFAGTIAALGEGVESLVVGDVVAGSGFGGGLAEYAISSAGAITKLPSDFDIRLAAGFGLNYTTALHGLLDRGALKSGETVLVLGAAGGTGIAAVQVAAMAGARVIAGASTPEKRAFALEHGATDSIDYTQDGWRKELKAMTDGGGVDVVFDPVGDTLLEPAFRSMAWRGRYLVIGFAGGAIPALSVNLALLKGAALIGVDYRQYGSVYERGAADITLQEAFAAVARGDLKPPLGQCFEFDDFASAMSLAASRDGLGKTVVIVS